MPDAAVKPGRVQQPGPPREAASDAVKQNEQKLPELGHSKDPSWTVHVSRHK